MESREFDFPVIDAHVHLYPDAVAKKVTPLLGAKFGNAPAFDGTVEGCRARMRACGIAAAINLPVATEARQVAHTNEFWRRHATGAPIEMGGDAQVFSLASLHPEMPDKAAEIARIASAGFVGIKFHPEYQNFRFNDLSMDETWDAMRAHGLVAYLHAGGERVFKPPFHSTPTDIRRLHERFPRLKIVAAHLGGFGMWDEAERALAHEDVFLDLSHTFFWMEDAQILRMIRAHGAHRILFGSDAPWQDPGKVLDALCALPLTCAEFRAICFSNAAELFRLPLDANSPDGGKERSPEWQ